MKKLYAEQKHTTNEIGAKIGLSSATLYNYVKGKRNKCNMPVSTLIKIASLEEIEPMDLYFKMVEYENKHN